MDDQITYEIEWDRRTLDGMHPVYKNRCERDGLDPETMWLGEEDLEADDGTPVPIEQPTAIRTPPLSEKDQDDRVRKALGLTHDDPLPEISHETLSAYHRYLAAQPEVPLHRHLRRGGDRPLLPQAGHHDRDRSARPRERAA